MKHLKLIIYLGLTVFLINCSNMKNKDNPGGNNGNKPKEFASPMEAAKAAKNDMMTAMDKNVNFGVDKEKLRSSNPGEAIIRNELDMNALLSADSTTAFEKISTNTDARIVPLITGKEVIAVVSIKNDNNNYSIVGLGDNAISSELNMIYTLNREMTTTIMEIPNLNATIYEMKGPNGVIYYTSYNGHNLRVGISSAELIKILKTDAAVFQRKFGDKLKKQKLVH